MKGKKIGQNNSDLFKINGELMIRFFYCQG